LPASTVISFRERLIAHKEFIESNGTEQARVENEFLRKAEALLIYYEDQFGVDDFIDFEK